MRGPQVGLIDSLNTARMWPSNHRRGSTLSQARQALWLPRLLDVRRICRVAPSVRKLGQIHPYPAKMMGEISASVLLEMRHRTRSASLLDMMCGTGTSLMHGRILGWRTVGLDINALAVLISRVKTEDYTRESLAGLSESFTSAFKQVGSSDWKQVLESSEYASIDSWYCPGVLKTLAKVRVAVDQTATSPRYKRILRLCLARTARIVSKADPEVMPPTISKRWRRSFAYRRHPDVMSVFGGSLIRMVESLVSSLGSYLGPKSEVLQKDARHTGLPAHSFDLCFFSPPYFTAHDYVRSTKLEMLVAGLVTLEDLGGLRDLAIGGMRAGVRSTAPVPRLGIVECDRFLRRLHLKSTERAHHLKSYLDGMQHVLAEAKRVVNPRGSLILVVGDGTSQGIHVPLARLLHRVAAEEGFTLVKRPIRSHIVSRGFMTKRNSTAGVIESEWILSLKPAV